jgi:hypothetical protein
MNKKIKVYATVAAVVIFFIGFEAGMEYKAYQIRKAVGDAVQGVADIFGGVSAPKKTDGDPSPKNQFRVQSDLTKKVGLEITKKGFYSANFQSQNTFTFEFTNNTGKDVDGVQGTLAFSDLFGNPIQQIKVSYDEGIKAGEVKSYAAGVDYNQFIDKDIKLRDTDLTKLKYDWQVDTIVYSDGTTESE